MSSLAGRIEHLLSRALKPGTLPCLMRCAERRCGPRWISELNVGGDSKNVRKPLVTCKMGRNVEKISSAHILGSQWRLPRSVITFGCCNHD
jgi:hypothetical protein